MGLNVDWPRDALQSSNPSVFNFETIQQLLMPALFEFHHRVVPEEIDGVGHVNNIEYLRWLQNAAVAHSAAQGWPQQAYYQLGQGWVVRSHFIEYLHPAFVGDEIIVRTWVADMKRVTSLRRYELLRPADGKQLAVARTNWAFVNFTTHLPCRVPTEVMNAFELVPDLNE
jgi:acyl-CoA thioester hydrolase